MFTTICLIYCGMDVHGSCFRWTLPALNMLNNSQLRPIKVDDVARLGNNYCPIPLVISLGIKALSPLPFAQTCNEYLYLYITS